MNRKKRLYKRALSLILTLALVLGGMLFDTGLIVEAGNVLPDSASTLEDFTGLEFGTPAPELTSDGDRVNVLKLAGQKTLVTIPSETAEKRVTFDFKYDGTAESYGGLYFSLYRQSDSEFDGLGGSMLPAWGNKELMTNMYTPSLAQQEKHYTLTASTWYSCIMELDGTSMRFKVYESGSEVPTEWTMEATIPENYLTTEADCDAILKLDGTVSNVAFYLDDITMEALESGSTGDDGQESDGETAVDSLDKLEGLEFGTPTPELTSDGDRVNVLKLAGQKTLVTIPSETAEKRVTFDFKYDGTAESYGGLYFSLYRQTDSDFDGLGGSMLPAWTNKELMTNMYVPSLEQQEKQYTLTASTWYSCIMELDGTSMRFKVYEAGSEAPAAWTMEAQVPADYQLTTEADCDAILKLDGTVSNVAFYLDDITIEALESNGGGDGEQESDGTEEAGDPQYTYFFDDYEDYVAGAVEKKNMPAKYVSFENGNYQIVEVDGKGNVLQGDATSKFYVDCSIIEKEVSFDFLYQGAMESYSGLYVKLLVKEAAKNEQYFSINPGFNNQNLIVTNTTNSKVEQVFTEKSFAENTWYSVKSRMVNQKIYVKIWPTASEEPEDWTSICEMSAPVTDNENALFWMELHDTNTATPLKMQFDNFSIKTWDELQAKTEYTITTKVNDTSMGTVSGEGTYLEGNTATLKAEANEGYELINWTDEDGEVVSTDESYSFKVNKDRTFTANFEKTIPIVKSFMADGMTLPAEIDTDAKTISVIFASDVDLTQVHPYFYFENGDGTEAKPYEVMDLSDGTEDIGCGWTVTAKQNRVMLNFYVDGVDGSDDNTGRSPKEAFATIAKAQEAVRALETWSGDVLVNIVDGEYVLTETLEFDSSDSAENGCSVIYRSLSGNAEDVIISSGIELKGWKESNTVEGAWEIDASEIAYSRDLYVDGERATLARTSENESIQPDGGWGTANDSELEMVPSYGYIASGSKGDLHAWKNKSDIEFVYEVAWTYSVIPVASIEDNGDGTSKITMHADAYQGAQTKAGRQIQDPNYIQNAFELLDEEGEWYFDRTDKKIYYIPEAGKNPNEQDIVIPTLDQLITVEGTEADTVDGLAFKDMTFEYTSYLRPHTMGQVEIQANFVVDPDMDAVQKHDNYLKTPGGVTAAYATGIRVAGCTFRNFSASGLDFEEGVVGSTIVGNEFYDISASGIQIGGVKVRDAQPYSETTYVKGVLVEDAGADPERVTEQILIMSNELENIGADYKGSIGIFVGFARDITIAHNDVSNTPYTGISAGWGWGYWDEGGRSDSPYYTFDTPTIQERYVIENNHITKVCSRLADGGSIYTLSLMPGSIIRGNVMDDCKVVFGGIYNDEGSGGFKAIENNIATTTVHTPYNYHLVIPGYADRKADTQSVMKNNYFGVDSSEDALYGEILDNAGLLTLAADRTFKASTGSSITGGTVSVQPAKARAGEIITITSTAATGYTLKEILVNGIAYEDSMLIMPDENTTISAVFTADKTDDPSGTPAETPSGKPSGTTSGSGSSKNSDSKTENIPIEIAYSSAVSSAGGVSTGDNAAAMPYIICMLVAGAVIVFMYYYRKRENK